MASKKGIAVTAIILVAITGASFIFWIPEENPSTFVVTDYENHLDGVQKIQEVLDESIGVEFQNLIDGKITPDEYIISTDATKSQVTAQITEFVKSKPPEDWQESYISYMEALKKFNAYLIETKVAANAIGQGNDLTESLQKTEDLKKEYQTLIEFSDQARP